MSQFTIHSKDARAEINKALARAKSHLGNLEILDVLRFWSDRGDYLISPNNARAAWLLAMPMERNFSCADVEFAHQLKADDPKITLDKIQWFLRENGSTKCEYDHITKRLVEAPSTASISKTLKQLAHTYVPIDPELRQEVIRIVRLSDKDLLDDNTIAVIRDRYLAGETVRHLAESFEVKNPMLIEHAVHGIKPFPAPADPTGMLPSEDWKVGYRVYRLNLKMDRAEFHGFVEFALGDEKGEKEVIDLYNNDEFVVAPVTAESDKIFEDAMLKRFTEKWNATDDKPKRSAKKSTKSVKKPAKKADSAEKPAKKSEWTPEIVKRVHELKIEGETELSIVFRLFEEFNVQISEIAIKRTLNGTMNKDVEIDADLRAKVKVIRENG